MTRVVGWGILGTGRIAHDFATGLALVADARLAAVTSRTMAKAEGFASRFRSGRPYDKLDAMLADDAVDVVYVATPPHRHAEDCLAIIAAGKAVLCEKPFAVSAGEARRVVEAARRRGVFCMEAMWMRFMPLVREAKRLIDEGAIGQPLMITADFGYPASAEAQPHLFSRAMGGALLDRGVYLLSLSRMILGAPTSWRVVIKDSGTGVDEQCAMILSHATGAISSLAASLRVLAGNEALIMGSAGSLRLHAPFYKPHRLTLKTFGPPSSMPFVPGGASFKDKLKASSALRAVLHRLEPLLGRSGRATVRTYEGNGYSYEAREVTRCLAEGKRESDLMPLDDTIAIIELMEAMLAENGGAHGA